MRTILTSSALFCCISGYSQKVFTVHFEFNKHTLTRTARMQLDSFLTVEKQNLSNSIFSLDGYCDPIGTNDYNKTLSMNRAATVKKFLLGYGLKPGNFSGSLGHGEEEPLNENKTEEERQINRRVQITMTNVGQIFLPKESALPTQKIAEAAPKESASLTQKITDTATKAGTSIVLKNINFFGGTPFLLPESSPTMSELLNVMRRNPKLVIEIQGHICCIADPGDSPYSATGVGLSEERAKAIYAELIGRGIEASRVSYKGFGHSMPIFSYPEQTEEERVANRRVEIKIISK